VPLFLVKVHSILKILSQRIKDANFHLMTVLPFSNMLIHIGGGCIVVDL
jgi:hypothetical protein